MKHLKEYREYLNDNFWKWFGNSEVKESGTPIVLYHGTNSNFDTFKLRSGSKSSFTNNKTLANSYGDVIYSVYLRIENPYIIECEGDYIWNFIGERVSPEDFFEGVVPFIYDGIIFKNVIDFNGALGSKYVLDVSDVYMVRKPNQIKSVENGGTWNVSEDNIFS